MRDIQFFKDLLKAAVTGLCANVSIDQRQPKQIAAMANEIAEEVFRSAKLDLGADKPAEYFNTLSNTGPYTDGDPDE